MNDWLLIQYAMQFVGTPYLWGGNDPSGWDCSGLVQELLAAMGMDPPGDQTAQALYDWARKYGAPDDKLQTGSLAFYGPYPSDVKHVAMLLDNKSVIEAGGGNAKTTSPQKAWDMNAYVRVRPIRARKDLLGIYFLG